MSLFVPQVTNKLRLGEHLTHVILPSCFSYSSITGSERFSSPRNIYNVNYIIRRLI